MELNMAAKKKLKVRAKAKKKAGKPTVFIARNDGVLTIGKTPAKRKPKRKALESILVRTG